MRHPPLYSTTYTPNGYFTTVAPGYKNNGKDKSKSKKKYEASQVTKLYLNTCSSNYTVGHPVIR